jgi:hypothetical protein
MKKLKTVKKKLKRGKTPWKLYEEEATPQKGKKAPFKIFKGNGV